ncbi:beta-galactosidase [Carboxylicivirga linearis]|uniref:Beta-galactosidase n=1 Tax=Carboxylicivirga linearis TaxID=1628157 RepID=A0ABS5JZ36_9BACT|nr:beta-galactosidase [Carboxylicivirga linearis]MBS2099581.1 beta-galactosidase [Carboxylicivirga linearis]
MKYILTLICIASFSLIGKSQSQKFDEILYGVAYYHEYMPQERLDEDIRMMKESGINLVRLGESTWSLFEPREGEFEFAWMDRIIDKMHQAGIKVILGTPTYSIPAWLWHKHPEVLLEYQKGGKAYYGMRQNMDLTNPTYLFYSERIIRKLMEHYVQHPAIIGFQVDNETTDRGVNNYDFQVGFINHLKKKFKTTENLNKTWGLNYWGMNIDGWEELPPRDGISNTGYKLEWDRYKRKEVADFLKWQSAIVREYKREDQFVTHCFMTAFEEVDQATSSELMDVMGVNVYHDQQDHLTGREIALAGDYFRSVKHQNYLVMETNAQTMGWNSRIQRPPYPGQLRQNVYAHLGSGANMVEYWHWHSIHYGQETYWKGILSHDLKPNRAYREMSKTAHELKKIGKKLVNLKKENKVAILFSHDSNSGLNFMPFNKGGNGWGPDHNNYYNWGLTWQFHNVLYRNNVGVDFVFPDTLDYDEYKLLIIPSLYIASDELLEKINNYIKNGGHVILQFKSGFCDDNSMVRPVLAPGPLREACGFYYQEFSNIGEMKLKGDPFAVGEGNNIVHTWAEYIIPETAKPLAYYDYRYFDEYPAITSNDYGKGKLIYEGCMVSDAIQEKILMSEIEELGLTSPDQELHWPLITKSGINTDGKTIHYYYNYSSGTKEFNFPYEKGIELLTNTKIKKQQTLQINPWGVIIIEED